MRTSRKVALSIVAASAVLQTICVFARGAEYTVGASGADFTSVQAAMDAALAGPAAVHTITILDSRVYAEDLTPSADAQTGDGFVLQAAEGQSPAVRSLYVSSRCYAGWTIRGLTFDSLGASAGPAAGLYFHTESDLWVEDCAFRGGEWGADGTAVLVREEGAAGAGKTATVRNCTFELTVAGKGYGVWNYGLSKAGLVVEGCAFRGGLAGVTDRRTDVSSGAVTIRRNVFDSCAGQGYLARHGVSPTTTTIEHNTFYRCGLGAWDGVKGAVVVRNSDQASFDFGAHVRDNLIYDSCGLSSHLSVPTNVDADHNGFGGAAGRAGWWQGAARTLDELQSAYLGCSGNVASEVDPFVDVGQDDFRLRPGVWALSAGSDGWYVGALGPVLAAGDATRNGFIDDSDLSLLLSHWAGAGGWDQGDFDGSGAVNDNDLSLLLSHWTGRPSAAAVPEPASVTVVLTVAAAAGRRRRL